MQKYKVSEMADVIIKNRSTGEIEYQGTMLNSDIKIKPTLAFRYRKGHAHYENLMSCIGETLNLEEMDADGNVLSNGDYEVSLEDEDIILTKI